MGQQESTPIDPNIPPHTLSSRDLAGVAEFIQDGRPKKIVVCTGAGISTSAGIPDFRSPDTGLYANLARLNLPYAEAVFDISYFREHPEPFYALAKELYPGRFHPTVTHAFLALLVEKGMLEMLFTQNIDCLERRAGVPESKIVEAHGSFATQRCIECKTEFDDDLMKKAVESGKAPHCLVPQCNGLVKPDIVFFGEQLPEKFHQSRHVLGVADLVIVMGTSLTVHPFASLPQLVEDRVPRILINKERVGDFGSRLDDVMVLEDCDTGVRKLADALGWRDELEGLWLEVGGKVREKEATRLREQRQAMSKDEILEAEIEKITEEVDASLQVSKDHMESVNKTLAKSVASAAAAKASKENHGLSDIGSEFPVQSQGLMASSTSVKENTPINVEKIENEAPAKAPTVDARAFLDVTLPHNRPNARSESTSTDKKPSSHI